MSKKLKALFLVSIVFNILLAGFIGGLLTYKEPEQISKGKKPRHHPPRMDNISPELENKFHNFMRNNVHKVENKKGRIQELKIEMLDIISADVIDDKAYKKNLIEMSEYQKELHDKISQKLKVFFSELSPEERDELIKGLKEHLPKEHRPN